MSKLKKERIKLKPLHCGVSVPNIDESIAWYEEKLDFKLVYKKFMPFLNAHIAFLEHGSFSIELFEVLDGKPLPYERRIPNHDIKTHGTKHVAYAIEDMRSFAETLKALGVDFATEIMNIENSLVLFIRDNAGNLIEFIEEGNNLETKYRS